MTAQGLLVYGSIGLMKVAPPALSGRGVPPTNLQGILGQNYFDLSTTPPTGYQWNGSSWVIDISVNATFTTLTVTGQTTLAATDIVGTTNINTTGAAVTTIGTGGTGAVAIGNATGNTAVTGTLTSSAGITASTGNIVATAGAVTAGTTMTAGTGITATTGNITASAGSVNAGTSITATLGDITATNGNVILGTAGNKFNRTSVASTIAAGANSIGTITLIGGTITISTTAVTASSMIRLWRESVGATGAAATGNLTVGTRVVGTSFVINAVSAADSTALQATDVSVVGWEIIN